MPFHHPIHPSALTSAISRPHLLSGSQLAVVAQSPCVNTCAVVGSGFLCDVTDGSIAKRHTQPALSAPAPEPPGTMASTTIPPISKSHPKEERARKGRREEADRRERLAGPAGRRARPLAGNVTCQPPPEAPLLPSALINSKLQ